MSLFSEIIHCLQIQLYDGVNDSLTKLCQTNTPMLFDFVVCLF